MDDCLDKEVVCVGCGQVARVLPAENQDFWSAYSMIWFDNSGWSFLEQCIFIL